ncbi:MAG: hypothetical protein A2722_00680 [Candidatus Doudnabacteria bacterium RIFCSPHIGHO2_01_FULL_50_11]|uniref:Thymidylate kinase n=1 Tax=Candidatus Doudnabacteria bacterium RIFCSPHIGHO2_01_FULL_50_11 TaxID=1817828 RepID=A0A1F5PLS8_9BACT|nr:MAG: hypothetical protein A2722_00680 [Candidatus Doudnabacteria bacterium RIFCSPHIGHO2_01_FULL_50_11]HLC44339.1 deoxynucleoside kinase [Patescibacteria group bacterium]
MSSGSGKFIVIDGTDGSGKATQTKILGERLRDEGYEYEIADFPQYGRKSAGPLEEYLNGKYGEMEPYSSSILFAVDRYDASFKIRSWLAAGKIVVSNRYVTANAAHQGGRISDRAKREKYFQWLMELEYGIFKLPTPNLNVILHLPVELAQQLVDRKSPEQREYNEGKKRDILESDINHLRNAEAAYLEIATTFPNTRLIECVSKGELMTPEEIHEILWKTISPIIKVK